MKRFTILFLAALLAVFLFTPVQATAEGTVSAPVYAPHVGYATLTFTITGDASSGSVPLTAFTHALGTYFYQLKTASATDDTYTVSVVEMITATLSVPLITKATTSGTTGAVGWPAGFTKITGTLKIDVTDLAAGEVCTVVLILM